jgi:hypothetical protein
MNRKYEFTGITKIVCGRTLHRICAVRDFGNVKSGDLGGWIEREINLSHDGNAWVSDNAKVCGNAKVKSSSDYMVFKNSWSSMRWFTYTASNKMWSVGCFHGTGEELIKKVYVDSDLSGRCYEAIVKAVEEIDNAKEEVKG